MFDCGWEVTQVQQTRIVRSLDSWIFQPVFSFDRRSEKAAVGICMVGDDEQGDIRASREDKR